MVEFIDWVPVHFHMIIVYYSSCYVQIGSILKILDNIVGKRKGYRLESIENSIYRQHDGSLHRKSQRNHEIKLILELSKVT